MQSTIAGKYLPFVGPSIFGTRTLTNPGAWFAMEDALTSECRPLAEEFAPQTGIFLWSRLHRRCADADAALAGQGYIRRGRVSWHNRPGILGRLPGSGRLRF